MGWKKKSPNGVKPGELTAFIDQGSEIEGTYTFSGTVMINGKFSGEISTGDTLIVGEKALLKASIQAGTVVISGEVVGNVRASERAELRGTARVSGDVEAPVIVVEEGVLFDGHCRNTKAKPEALGHELSALDDKR